LHLAADLRFEQRTLDRAEARAFETKWLSWLGPWRMSFGLSQMEHSRQDIDSPLFMAWRVSAMPTRKFEFGLSRTAQFCGRELPCGLHTFSNVLIGHDNPKHNISAADEPGNQMGGYDVRWSSPIGNLPYAIYGQYIGEDVSGYLPAKYLSQLGLEIWHPRSDGGLVQGFFEYASTSCTGKHGTVKACAYNQGRFNVEGYRYLGRFSSRSLYMVLGFAIITLAVMAETGHSRYKKASDCDLQHRLNSRHGALLTDESSRHARRIV
jgi:hypothetical protein